MTDDTTDMASTLSALEREAPVLSRLRRFAQGLEEAPWFAHLGEAPAPRVRELAAAYTEALGYPEASLSIAPTWEDAAAAAETLDWSSPAWETEELMRADLTAKALAVVSDDALSVGLGLVAQSIGDAARAAMEEQAAYWDVIEQGPRDLAVGAAAQAAHHAGLLLIAAAEDPDLEDPRHHPAALRLALFEAGRWPIAIVGTTFSLF